MNLCQQSQSDWLTFRSGCGLLIYSAWQGLTLIAPFKGVTDPSSTSHVMSSCRPHSNFLFFFWENNILNFIYKRDNFCDLLFAVLHTSPLQKRGLHSLATRPIYKYVCHFFFLLFFFSFIFYFLIQCLASLWVNFSSVVVSEIYWPSQKRNCSCSFHWVVIVCG